MLGTDVPVELGSVVVGIQRAVDHAQRIIRKGRVGFLIGAVGQGIKATVVKQLVLQNASADVRAVVGRCLMDQIVGLVDEQGVRIEARGFKLLGLEITEDVAVKLIGAALGDHVDDAAESLSVLGFKATRLHLDFLDKVEIDAVTQRAVYAAVGSKAAEPGVGDVRAVDDVFVLKTGSAVD